MSRVVKNEKQFLDCIEAEDRNHAEKHVYKGTDCGAWIEFQEPGVVRSTKKERWTVRLRLSIAGIIAMSVRKAHGRSITRIEDLPAQVLEYLHLDQGAKTPAMKRRVDIGDSKSGEFFRTLEGRMRGTTKVHSFEINGTRKFRGGIVLGSIVEGIDACATPVELEYPFTEEEYYNALQQVEDEVNYLWEQTHGCDDCDIEGEFGGNAINPDCKTCHGEGTIL